MPTIATGTHTGTEFKLQQSWEISDQASDQLLGSADAMEGTQAFLEKRKPVWTGR